MSRCGVTKKTIGELQKELGYTDGNDPLNIRDYYQKTPAPSGNVHPDLNEADLVALADAWLSDDKRCTTLWPLGGKNGKPKWCNPKQQKQIRETVRDLFLAKWKKWMTRPGRAMLGGTGRMWRPGGLPCHIACAEDE